MNHKKYLKYLGYNRKLKANVYKLPCGRKMYEYLTGKVEIK